MLPKKHDETEKLEIRKPAPKPKSITDLARNKQQDIQAKQKECKVLVDDVEKSTLLFLDCYASSTFCLGAAHSRG